MDGRSRASVGLLSVEALRVRLVEAGSVPAGMRPTRADKG